MNRIWTLHCLILLLTVGASGSAADKEKWRDLFDGKTLKGWKVTNFGGEGDVTVEQETIRIGFGSPLSGITFTGEIPKINYELRFEARRDDGSDFFGSATFPVQDSFCTFVVGGWAGSVVGLSSIDDDDASQNETTRFMTFRSERWYRIRIRVTKQAIQAWIDDRQIVNQDIEGRKLSTRAEVELSQPLGIASFETQASLRKIQIRKLTAEKSPENAQRGK